MTATPLTLQHTRGPLRRLGITCYCVWCNVRYRAVGKIPLGVLIWLGRLGRALWWQATTLEQTLQAPSFYAAPPP